MKIFNNILLASIVLSAIGIITAGGLVGWQASSIEATTIEKRAFSQLVAIREIQIATASKEQSMVVNEINKNVTEIARLAHFNPRL